MPEGPELRVDAEQLDFFLAGRTLKSIELINALFENKCEGLDELRGALPLVVDRVRSRAKKLFIFLKSVNNTPQWVIFMTYGMTGKISCDKEEHSHLQFRMSHSHVGFDEFFYTDPRRIGSFEASCDPEDFTIHVEDFAKPIVFGYREEGFDPITRDEFDAKIKAGKNGYLASRLMNQHAICSGIGNYVLSESLYEAGLDPFICCNELNESKLDSLWNAIHKVMITSYEHGGMSHVNYVNPSGSKGTFGNHCKVYDKEGQTIDGYKIHSCKGSHGRTIWFTEENGSDTLKHMNDS
jgi:formamidopyrimidine-DNA glycosylase